MPSIETRRRVKSATSLVGIDVVLLPLITAVLTSIFDNFSAVEGQLALWLGAGSALYIIVRAVLYQLVALGLNYLADWQDKKADRPVAASFDPDRAARI